MVVRPPGGPESGGRPITTHDRSPTTHANPKGKEAGMFCHAADGRLAFTKGRVRTTLPNRKSHTLCLGRSIGRLEGQREIPYNIPPFRQT